MDSSLSNVDRNNFSHDDRWFFKIVLYQQFRADPKCGSNLTDTQVFTSINVAYHVSSVGGQKWGQVLPGHVLTWSQWYQGWVQWTQWLESQVPN